MAIALSFEISPFLQNGSLFQYEESTQTPFRVACNTPLVSPLVPFANCAEALGMHPATASILDDMRFLSSSGLSLPEKPTAKEQQKVATTATWIYERMNKLPADSPMSRRPSAPLPARQQSGSPEAPTIPLDPRLSGPDPDAVRQHRTPPDSGDGGSQRASSRGASSRRGSPQSSSGGSNLRPGGGPATAADARRASRTPSPGRAAAAAAAPPPDADQPDALYQAVRQTALIYSRAISQRRPFSAVVSPADFLQLWTTTWRVSLTNWKGLVGVFMWIILAIVASARNTPHDRFVKSMLSICAVQNSLENWETAIRALRAALQLGAWLGGGSQDGGQGGADPLEASSSGSSRKGTASTAAAAADGHEPVTPPRGSSAAATEAGGAEEAMMEVVVDFATEESTEFSGGGKAIREQGSTFPDWNP